jgi:hypothetical protein
LTADYAMFGQGWSEYLAWCEEMVPTLPEEPRARLRAMAHQFFAPQRCRPAWFQLLNQRLVPGFEPSAEAYAPSVAVMDLFKSEMAGMGVADEEALDMWVALLGGLVAAQLANDPGGSRYERLLDRAVDMYADHVGLAREEASR